MRQPISIAIVDDHQMFREGIRSRIERESDMTVVGEAGTAEEAFDLVVNTKPTVLILDIRLPSMSGLEAARRLRNKHPDLSILLLTGHDFDQYVRAAARARSRAGQREHTGQRDFAATWSFEHFNDTHLSVYDRSAAGNRDDAGTGVVAVVQNGRLKKRETHQEPPSDRHSWRADASLDFRFDIRRRPP